MRINRVILTARRNVAQKVLNTHSITNMFPNIVPFTIYHSLIKNNIAELDRAQLIEYNVA